MTVVTSTRPVASKRKTITMLYNYLKVGIRNILRYKVFSFINSFGLAAAMSVCMLIMLVIADQKGYDSWQTNKDRVYRVETVGRNGNGMTTATSALPLAEHHVAAILCIEDQHQPLVDTAQCDPAGRRLPADHLLAEISGGESQSRR